MDRWLWDVWPGFGARACSNLLKPLRGTWWNHADEIVSQSQYSSVAFVITNPQKADDEIAVYTAGLEGSLRAYESILNKPMAEWPIVGARWWFLDSLIEKRNKGVLTEYVRQAATHCSDNVD
jgi:hypothetical protein